jgi:glycosyltransferase involved in cell wall biosynthesis
MQENYRLRICVVGAGTHFLSGISHYTCRLANALADTCRVSAILMRRLLPARFYPGRQRIGAALSCLEYSPAIHVFDGVDWFWFPSIVRVLAFLVRERPDIVIFQWWSGTVLHSYLVLALLARLLRARIVIEFHEVLDTGEARLLFARIYVRLIAPLILRQAQGFVVHSRFDLKTLEQRYGFHGRPVALIPHGPYSHYQQAGDGQRYRMAPASCCNLLFFGVIRPFKGLEDLIMAFDALPEDQISAYWLTIVGETWEGWTLPADLIARSRYRDRITFINRYVSDAEAAALFAGADAVVLPYRRSSASGPLHLAMSYGLPVVVTRVGGLPEAVADYAGAVLVPPRDPIALQAALIQIARLRGQRFSDPHSWERTVASYRALFAALFTRSRSEVNISETTDAQADQPLCR